MSTYQVEKLEDEIKDLKDQMEEMKLKHVATLLDNARAMNEMNARMLKMDQPRMYERHWFYLDETHRPTQHHWNMVTAQVDLDTPPKKIKAIYIESFIDADLKTETRTRIEELK